MNVPPRILVFCTQTFKNHWTRYHTTDRKKILKIQKLEESCKKFFFFHLDREKLSTISGQAINVSILANEVLQGSIPHPQKYLVLVKDLPERLQVGTNFGGYFQD